jgi:hypothetical protein
MTHHLVIYADNVKRSINISLSCSVTNVLDNHQELYGTHYLITYADNVLRRINSSSKSNMKVDYRIPAKKFPRNEYGGK